MRKLFSIFLLGLLFVGCSSDLDEYGDYYGDNTGIIGSVSDSKTGEPVATVNVTLSPDGHSAVTGSDGSFSFNNLYYGEYTVTLKKEGYKSTSETFYVQSGQQTPAHMLIERIPANNIPRPRCT